MRHEIQFAESERILYVLKLEDNCFYVGQTIVKNFEMRIKKHFNGRGSNWTKLHKPLEIIEKHNVYGDYRQCEHLENEKTVEYMKKYGMKNVRGGFFSQVSEVGLEKNLKHHGFKL